MSKLRVSYAQNLTNEILTKIAPWLNVKMTDNEFFSLDRLLYDIVERETVIKEEVKHE